MAKGVKSNKQGPKAPAKNESQKARIKNYPTGDASLQSVNEPDVAYGYRKQVIASSLPSEPVVSALPILSDATNKPESHMTPLEKMGIAREGISKKDLESLKEKTALDYDKLAVALSVTRATLINKKGEEKFNSTLSERIIDLAGLYSYGYEVFEDEARFNQWMFRPNRALGGQAPYDVIDNQFGREEVRNIIGRIDYGVYS